jgi:hypothetical protein
MNFRIVITTVMILFVAGLDLEAQETAPPAAQQNATSVPGPDSRAEWAITISISGGYDGGGRGGFSVTSAGGLTCFSTTPCTRQIPKPDLQSLEGLIDSAILLQALQMIGVILPIPVQTSPSVCFDCIVTTMSLRIRDSKGVAWLYAWSWDVTTQSSIPIGFMRIFRAATDLSK